VEIYLRHVQPPSNDTRDRKKPTISVRGVGVTAREWER
jgi:hypothetical protein